MNLLKELHDKITEATENPEWTKDEELLQKIFDNIIKEVQRKGEAHIPLTGELDISPSRLNGVMKLEQEIESKFGAFNLIIKDAHVSVILRSGDNPKSDEFFNAHVQLGYNHHEGGSNGYDIGWVWLDSDGQVTNSRVKSKPEVYKDKEEK